MKKEQSNEDFISELDDLSESVFVSPAQEDALEAAKEALAFGQSLWNLFRDQGLHDDETLPDYAKMENLIDAINGELAAAVLFLCNNADQSSRTLLMIASQLEEVKKSSGNSEEGVPNVVIEGYKRLSKRIKNTQTVLLAKQSVQVLSTKID